METRILAINGTKELGRFDTQNLDRWEVLPGFHVPILQEAAARLKKSDVPVAFPTETVYGLGADATRSGPVRGIYKAKGRPSDNPLIIHVCDLTMLRSFLACKNHADGAKESEKRGPTDDAGTGRNETIPEIYRPPIAKFWPGPLTIILPKPASDDHSCHHLAPEVTAGLNTFGARMPKSELALSLIQLAGTPLAAPSANASTKPSPTTAQHVKDDLNGRIELILDGGSCQVGVESTVVDGLCDPPVILRPGGVGIEELRECPGWEKVEIAYKDKSETGDAAPRAPGMKYKHYSPRAKVILFEHSIAVLGTPNLGKEAVRQSSLHEVEISENTLVGIIRTRLWTPLNEAGMVTRSNGGVGAVSNGDCFHRITEYTIHNAAPFRILDVALGKDIPTIARGLFAALRELDRRGASVIFVEGIDDSEDISAAVMNRLRKAASDIRV